MKPKMLKKSAGNSNSPGKGQAYMFVQYKKKEEIKLFKKHLQQLTVIKPILFLHKIVNRVQTK